MRALGLGKRLSAGVAAAAASASATCASTTRCRSITVDPETYEVRADGELLRHEPAAGLPLAQRYSLF